VTVASVQLSVGSKGAQAKSVRGKIFVGLLATVLLTTASFAQAQQPGKVARIGYRTAASLSAIVPRIEAFRQGLRELAYVEGKTIVVEWRAADGQGDRLPGFAAELVKLKVDLIVTGGQGATGSAKQATSTIPIVMTQDDDPVENGFISSLARPGGNLQALARLLRNSAVNAWRS
jgi:putative ABC transport system substrate-binding protein